MTVTHEIGFGQRSYVSLDYMPKRYNTRAKSAIATKYRKLREEEKKLKAEKARIEKMQPRTEEPRVRKVSFVPPAAEPLINHVEVQVDLPDSRAAAKPIPSDEDSEEKDLTQHTYAHRLETDHPFSTEDPRNQYVQNNYRAKEPTYNRVRPHYATESRRNFSPANTVGRMKHLPPSPRTQLEWQNALMAQQRDLYAPQQSVEEETKLWRAISDTIHKKHNADSVTALVQFQVKANKSAKKNRDITPPPTAGPRMPTPPKIKDKSEMVAAGAYRSTAQPDWYLE